MVCSRFKRLICSAKVSFTSSCSVSKSWMSGQLPATTFAAFRISCASSSSLFRKLNCLLSSRNCFSSSSFFFSNHKLITSLLFCRGTKRVGMKMLLYNILVLLEKEFAPATACVFELTTFDDHESAQRRLRGR